MVAAIGLHGEETLTGLMVGECPVVGWFAAQTLDTHHSDKWGDGAAAALWALTHPAFATQIPPQTSARNLR